MATNLYFNNFNSQSEQSLIEDLVVESIKIYGHDVVYLPRRVVNRDFVFNEDTISRYENDYSIEMYIRNVDGFEGEGDFLSKFGLEVRDQITFTVAKRRFDNDIGLVEDIVRPRESDLLYFPLTKSYYEIKFVEHEAVFYQLGQIQMYDIRCELFEYSGEKFNTGDVALDALESDNLMNALEFSLQTEDGFNLANETDGPLIQELYRPDLILQANNDVYETQSTSFGGGAGIIDFSEKDPFSEGGY
jgi:hypothetical protein